MPVLQKERCWWRLGCFVRSLIPPPSLPAPKTTLTGAIWGFGDIVHLPRQPPDQQSVVFVKLPKFDCFFSLKINKITDGVMFLEIQSQKNMGR